LLDSSVSVAPAELEKTESAEQLLAAADDARLSGHPQQAVVLLRRLLRDHRGDARAPLAAFTLGRMLLMELANPIEAAAVFAEARRLSPQGPLAEDALAREVESLSQAGALALAKTRAQEYLRLYPDGRRATVVRRMAGIQ
jgi:transmembrane sensor